MSKPHFFCTGNALSVIGNLSYPSDHPTVNLSLDITELAHWLVFSADKSKWSLKVFERHEFFDYDEDGGFETGSLDMYKKSGKRSGMTSDKWLSENMPALLVICKNLSCYICEHDLMKEFSKLDPKTTGVLFDADGEALTYKIVSGEERPDLLCTSLFSDDGVMARPYEDDDDFDDDDFDGISVNDVSIEETIEAAEAGNESAMQALALTYLNGNDETEADPEKSLYWFTKLAELDNSVAQYNLALHYAKGHGTQRDFEKAAHWMNKAAENGDDDAPAVAEKYTRAAELTKLADAGDAQAQADLARIVTGLSRSFDQAGPEKDLKLAFELFEKSAVQGYKPAQFGLAKMYENGDGVEQDLDKAIEWGEKAATDGTADIQYEVAKLYTYTDENGEMIDVERAKYWYTQAAEKGHRMAQSVLNSPLFNTDHENKSEFDACGKIVKSLCEGEMDIEEAVEALTKILGSPDKALMLLASYFGVGGDDE